MTAASPTAKIRRAALDVLSRDTLTALSAHYTLDVADRRVAANHVDALVRSRSIDFNAMRYWQIYCQTFQSQRLRSATLATRLDALRRCGRWRSQPHRLLDHVDVGFHSAFGPRRIGAQHCRHAMPVLLGDPQDVLPAIKFQLTDE